jgi:hypothetical protein
MGFKFLERFDNATKDRAQTKKRIEDDRVRWRWRLVTSNRGGSDVPG